MVAGTPYRVSAGSVVRTGAVGPEGAVVERDLPLGTSCLVEWGRHLDLVLRGGLPRRDWPGSHREVLQVVCLESGQFVVRYPESYPFHAVPHPSG